MDITKLPIGTLTDEQWDALPELPIDAYRVGDLVAIYSRGRIREALVEKKGTKNITAVYTTRAAKLHGEQRAMKETPYNLRALAEDYDRRAEEYEEQAGGRPDDEWIQQSAYSRISVAGIRAHARHHREWAAWARQVADAIEADPKTSWTHFTTITRKTAPAEEVRKLS